MESLNKKTESVRGDNGYIYPLVKGEDLCCVPTCLEMIFKSMGYNVVLSELVSQFIIITPEKAETNIDIGVHITETLFEKIFRKYNLPLKDTYTAINTIMEDFLIDEISQELKNKSHILCGYCYGTLFKDKRYLNVGHFSIIIGVKNNKIILLNPGPNNFGINEVNDYELYRAILKKKAGLWVLKSI